MIKVCLTHDVDRVRKTYQYVTKTGKALLKGQFCRAWKMLKKGFGTESQYWGFDTVIDIENQYGVQNVCQFFQPPQNEIMPRCSKRIFKPMRISMIPPNMPADFSYFDPNTFPIFTPKTENMKVVTPIIITANQILT